MSAGSDAEFVGVTEAELELAELREIPEDQPVDFPDICHDFPEVPADTDNGDDSAASSGFTGNDGGTKGRHHDRDVHDFPDFDLQDFTHEEEEEELTQFPGLGSSDADYDADADDDGTMSSSEPIDLDDALRVRSSFQRPKRLPGGVLNATGEVAGKRPKESFLPSPRRSSFQIKEDDTDSANSTPKDSVSGGGHHRTTSSDNILRAASGMVSDMTTTSTDVPLLEQFKRSVQLMYTEEACNNPACRICRWPRSSKPDVDMCTGTIRCEVMQRKYRENMQLTYFVSTLRHLSVMLVLAHALIIGYTGHSYVGRHKFVSTSMETELDQFPMTALLVTTICGGVTAVALATLWLIELRHCPQSCDRTYRPCCNKRLCGAEPRVTPQSTHRRPRASAFDMGDGAGFGFEMSVLDRIWSAMRIGASPIIVVLILTVYFSFAVSIFYVKFGLYQSQRAYIALLYNETTQVGTRCTQRMLPASLNQSAGDLIARCEDVMMVSGEWDALQATYSDQIPYTESGDAANMSIVERVALLTMEEMNELLIVSMLLFGKFFCLFLMLIHSMEFKYILPGNFAFDLITLVVGASCVSTHYMDFLATNVRTVVWLFLFAVLSVPVWVTSAIVQRRTMQQFMVMYTTAEDNLRFQRPNIVVDCLHVDKSEKGKIGAGGAGQVFRGRYAGFKVAIKELFSAQMDNNLEESFAEAEVLARLRHPNIVTFYGIVFSSGDTSSAAAAPANRFQIVTELCHTSLGGLLEASAFEMNGRKLCAIALQIAYGMQYLHSINFEHYDIKPENILITRQIKKHTPAKQIHVKVADFGLARLVPMTSKEMATTAMKKGAHDAGWEGIRPAAGSFEFMPPELLRFEEKRHIKAAITKEFPSANFDKVWKKHGVSLQRTISPKYIKTPSPTTSAGSRVATALEQQLYGGSASQVLVDAAGDLHAPAGVNSASDELMSKEAKFATDIAVGAKNRNTDQSGRIIDEILPYTWDVYSFGVLLWQMHTRRKPFSAFLEPRRRREAKKRRNAKNRAEKQGAKGTDAGSTTKATRRNQVAPLSEVVVEDASPKLRRSFRGIGKGVALARKLVNINQHRRSASLPSIPTMPHNINKIGRHASNPNLSSVATSPDILDAVEDARLFFRDRISRTVDPRVLRAAAPNRYSRKTALKLFGRDGDLNRPHIRGMQDLIERCTSLSPILRPSFGEISSAMEEISQVVIAESRAQAKIKAAKVAAKKAAEMHSMSEKRLRSDAAARRVSAPAILAKFSKVWDDEDEGDDDDVDDGA